jgi:hypothetical protein
VTDGKTKRKRREREERVGHRGQEKIRNNKKEIYGKCKSIGEKKEIEI